MTTSGLTVLIRYMLLAPLPFTLGLVRPVGAKTPLNRVFTPTVPSWQLRHRLDSAAALKPLVVRVRLVGATGNDALWYTLYVVVERYLFHRGVVACGPARTLGS